MQKFIYIMAILMCFIACDNGNEDINLSSDSRVQAFTFYEDTVNPGLTQAVFKIEHKALPDTGLIYCTDSLLFGTCLDSVVPYVTYYTTPSAATFFTSDTTIVSTGADTLNMNDRPIYLLVQAADTAYKRWYRIDMHVHTANPELYVWQQLTSAIFTPQSCEMKAFYVGNQLKLAVNNGFSTQIYHSANGVHWSAGSATTGLPTPCHVRDIVQHGNTWYYADGDKLYTSSDLLQWVSRDYSDAHFKLVNMMVVFDNKPWCILQDRASEQLYLGVIMDNEVVAADTIEGLDGNKLPNDFPVSDFAALSFISSSERPRAMVVGGRTLDGRAVNTRWNMEYEASAGYRMVDFSIEQPSFNTLTGTSIIQYDGRLLMFGGLDNDLEWRSNILYSDDEGMNWYIPDTAHNQLPTTYYSRQNQTVVVDDKANIYIIGGQSLTNSYSDVYRGYLNKLKWAAIND